MTRELTVYAAAGGLLLLTACSSPTTDGATTRTTATGSGGSATGSGGSTSTGGAGGGRAGGSGGQGATGTGGSGTAGAGPGGAGTGGLGTGGAGTGGAAGTGGTGAAGSSGSGGTTAGSSGSGGARDGGSTGGNAGMTGTDAGRDATGGGSADANADRTSTDAAPTTFSFFVVSMKALQTLSGTTEGFGGDLRFGQADGLAGADEICRQTAEMGMPGAGSKTWRAFLSTTQGPGGTAINARDRIGPGPWYDRNGRLLAANLADLFAGARPKGDAMLVNDMTNERGEPNHYVGAGGYTPGMAVDNHDTLTGSDTMGMLRAASAADTCNDWTSTAAAGRPYIGHSWPRSTSSGLQWASDHAAPGCVPGLDRTLGGTGTGSCIGCSGGYGGFYCFALP